MGVRVFASVPCTSNFEQVYYQNDDFSHDWPIAIPMDYNSDNFTIPLTTVSTWIMFVVMFGFSLEPVSVCSDLPLQYWR